MGFLPSFGCVSATEWMHHINANKMYSKKAREELHTNAMCYFGQILGATLHKTACVQPLTFHLKTH